MAITSYQSNEVDVFVGPEYFRETELASDLNGRLLLNMITHDLCKVQMTLRTTCNQGEYDIVHCMNYYGITISAYKSRVVDQILSY